ncbi:MAG TPA: YihY/virulence factor BrkB family protein [Anaerolineaceae bacterium]
MKFKDLWTLLKKTYQDWSADKASQLAAALAYYTIFSLAPLLVIAIAVAGFVWGADAARGAIVDQISGLVGQQGAEQVQTMIQNASAPGRGIVATIIGVVVLILGATGVFNQLQDSMNTVFEVKNKPGQGVWAMIRERFLSFAMVLAIGFMLLVSLVVTAALTAVGDAMLNLFSGFEFLMQVVNFLVSFAVVTLLFAVMFKFLPDIKIAWKDTLLGAAVTSLLFTIGRTAIGLYLGNSDVGSAFGAAGSLIVLLVWLYYSGQILFFGAEFTQIYAQQYGKGIEPKENAVWLSEEDRLKQGKPARKPSQGAAQQVSAEGIVPRTVVDPQPRTATPSVNLSSMPVTGREPGEPQRDLWEASMPVVAAFLVGLAGSIVIARGERDRPVVVKKKK